eukprot:g76504.t1
MDDSSILAIKAQLERKARVKGLVEGYAFLADPKEAVLVATSKPEGCVTSEKQLSMDPMLLTFHSRQIHISIFSLFFVLSVFLHSLRFRLCSFSFLLILFILIRCNHCSGG